MKQFKVYWNNNKVFVSIHNDEEVVEMSYKKYQTICAKHDITLMRDIHDEIEYYVINDLFHEQSHLKILNHGSTMSLTLFSIKISDALHSIVNISIFKQEMENVDLNAPVIINATSSDGAGCCIIPTCSIN